MMIYMDCSRGGQILIILNEETAAKAAKYISSCNTNALWWQMGSQAVQGVLAGMTMAATGPVGLVEMNINVAIYCISEYDKDLGKAATVADVANSAREDMVACKMAIETVKEAKASADAANKAVSASEKIIAKQESTANHAGKTASKPGRKQAAARWEQSKAQKACNREKGRCENLKNKSTKAAENHQRAVSNRNVAFKTLFSGLALNITTAIFNNWIDGCSDAQETKYIDMAAKGANEIEMLDQSNESANSTFMGIVANIT